MRESSVHGPGVAVDYRAMSALQIKVDEIDTALIAYVEWHKHAHCVRIAYSAWLAAPEPEHARRYAAYLEELDREERACQLYASTLMRGVPRRQRPA
jgi:hypothetical protein